MTRLAIIASDGSPMGFRSVREAQPTVDDDYDHRERRPAAPRAARQGRRQGEALEEQERPRAPLRVEPTESQP
jgi:hypothetical protein